MQLKSLDFSHNDQIPARFTCDDQDVSPHLTWHEPPENTKSFALSCKDPDAPEGNWDHWLIVNIPASVNEIPQSETIGEEISNDFGKTGYGGPCPPLGTHRYIFKIYALDMEKLNGITKENFVEKVQEHTIESAELVGLYQRQ
ncbi:YbhB/YbcL family Raf kinase inhibitor-like protein [Patescibacteria group bacterium]